MAEISPIVSNDWVTHVPSPSGSKVALERISALFGCALVYRTASLGGDIVHHSTVLQSTPRPAAVPAPPPDQRDQDER